MKNERTATAMIQIEAAKQRLVLARANLEGHRQRDAFCVGLALETLERVTKRIDNGA